MATQNQSDVVQQLLFRWVALGVALIGAVMVAYVINSPQPSTFMYLASPIVVLITTVWLRDRAWILIPFSWSLTGSSALLPLGLSGRDVAIMLSVGAYLTYRILTQRALRPKIEFLDVLLGLNVLWAAITYVANPAGLRVLGAETIGGRPYVNIFLAVIAYWVLVRLPTSPWLVCRVPYYFLAGTGVLAGINLVAYVMPSVTPLLYALYSGVDVTHYTFDSPLKRTEILRWHGLFPFGTTLVFVLCAKFPPRILLNPLRFHFYLLALGLAAILASGFRNALLQAFAALALAACFHRGLREMLIGGIIGALLLGIFISGQGRLYELPLPAQRALCWLPGKWSQVALDDATISSEGRFQWWRDILRYELVKNWWIGDGFAVSIRDYEAYIRNRDLLTWMTLTGSYHNGPLTTIRAVGLIGLLFFYVFIIGSAMYSLRCVKICRNTPLCSAAIFLAVQMVWLPIHYTFVFGDFGTQMPTSIMMLALVKLITRVREQGFA